MLAVLGREVLGREEEVLARHEVLQKDMRC